MSYTVRRGDTLSAIAARQHVSLSALEKANPQIRNPNLITVGERLNIPGQKDSFEHKKPSSAHKKHAGSTHHTTGTKSKSGGKGTNAAAMARKYLGKYETQLQASGVTQRGVPTSESCANFVSSMLKQAGVNVAHTNGVSVLNNELRAKGWHTVSLKDAKPGDVWICNGAHGESHTEIVASNNNGHVTLIGSNNHPISSNQQINYDSYSANISGSFILAP